MHRNLSGNTVLEQCFFHSYPPPCTEAPDSDTVRFNTSDTAGIELLVFVLDKAGRKASPPTCAFRGAVVLPNPNPLLGLVVIGGAKGGNSPVSP